MLNKTISRIIFFIATQFNSRDYKRFGIELLKNNGFNVEIWDLSPILYPDLLQKYTPPDALYCDGLVIVNNRHEMRKKISDLSEKDFVVNLINYNFISLAIYKALNRSFVNYAVFCANAIPSVGAVKSNGSNYLFEKIRWLMSFRHKNVWENLFMKLPFQCLGVKPARLVLAGGDKCFNQQYPVRKKTEVLWIHTLDYDLYLKDKENFSSDKPIAVFLDEFGPFHPDYIVMGRDAPINADKYYRLLNSFFDLVEHKTGLGVVIAAHPRSNYENMPDYFKGRKCIRGKTINLVKECRMVLSHSSTALNFANLFNKPVIFITTTDLDGSYEGALIREMAKCFGKKPIFMDNVSGIDFKNELVINKAEYDKYRQVYIKTKHSKDMPFWQIVSDRLKTGFN